MKVPLKIMKELEKRGWKMLDGETWRVPRGLGWACAYFSIKNKVCLITVAQTTCEYTIQILWALPTCSMYVYDRTRRTFDVKLGRQ
jgi:hypothetical protein